MSIVERKRFERVSKIPKEWQIETPSAPYHPLKVLFALVPQDIINITSPDATTLLDQLSASQITAKDLTRAFCHRAAVAHQLTNCLSEILFTEAIARAEWLDQQPRPVGPLHGLPITVKDSFDIEGIDSSIGITPLCFEPRTSTSQLCQILTSYGAIIIAKTTVPQTMLTADTDSVVFGRTVNAHNSMFGAGGSSGGEAVIVAMGGSAFGLGTDGAGSVRMPAAVNGVIGYKPSGYRLPLDGRPILGSGIMGTTCIGPVSVSGILGRSMRDVQLVAKLVADAKPWEQSPFIYPHPWLELKIPQTLRIGVWKQDFLHLHPPVQRGFEHAQKLLRQAGHELVPFNSPDVSHVWDLQKEWVELQDLTYLRGLLSQEPHTEIVKATGIINREPPTVTLEYLHQLNREISGLVMAMHRAWDKLDVVLWVPAPHTAVPFDKYTYLGFTGLFNIIDWPAISLPLGLNASAAIDEKVDVTPYNALDAEIQALYDPQAFHGLPLGMQLIGRRFEDEKLLAVSEAIHQLVCQ